MAIKGSTLSLVAALKSHDKLKVMRDEDLFAGLPGGALCVCASFISLFLVCVCPSRCLHNVCCLQERTLQVWVTR